MNEILKIDEIINPNNSIRSIEWEIEYYERQIKYQTENYDWTKPSIESCQKTILELREEKDKTHQSLLDETKNEINMLLSNNGTDLIVCYSKKDRFIEIHRQNCQRYIYLIETKDSKTKICKSFLEANKIAGMKIKFAHTDIGDGCNECKPYWNLESLIQKNS
jgi:hypothetical protein